MGGEKDIEPKPPVPGNNTFCAKPVPASQPAISDIILLLIRKIVLGKPLRTRSFVTRTLINNSPNKNISKVKKTCYIPNTERNTTVNIELFDPKPSNGTIMETVV